jgi:hypothetical protein
MTLTDGRPTVSSPGPRIPAKDVDFRLRDEGTILLLYPISDDAVGWVDEFLPSDRTTWGGGIIVEHRYIGPILDGIDSDGLVVGRAG